MSAVDQDVLRRCLDDYVRCLQPAAFQQAAYYEGLVSLQDALTSASQLWVAEGTLHRHLYSISKDAKAKLRRLLPGCEERIERAPDFDAIYLIVKQLCTEISGAGDLVAYDTATHIGFHQRMRPSKVYLHSGALKGAKAIWPDRWLKSGDALEVTEFPEIVQELSAVHIENFLCIYNNELNKGQFFGSHGRDAAYSCGLPASRRRSRTGC